MKADQGAVLDAKDNTSLQAANLAVPTPLCQAFWGFYHQNEHAVVKQIGVTIAGKHIGITIEMKDLHWPFERLLCKDPTPAPPGKAASPTTRPV